MITKEQAVHMAKITGEIIYASNDAEIFILASASYRTALQDVIDLCVQLGADSASHWPHRIICAVEKLKETK